MPKAPDECPQCTARLKLIGVGEHKGKTYPRFAQCQNCGAPWVTEGGYFVPPNPPVTDLEFEQMLGRIRFHTRYERAIVVQDFWQLLWMIQRLRRQSPTAVRMEVFESAAEAKYPRSVLDDLWQAGELSAEQRERLMEVKR